MNMFEIRKTMTGRYLPGDNTMIYRISGCGMCKCCRRGYMFSCTSETYRKASGFGRVYGGLEKIGISANDAVHRISMRKGY